MVTIIVNVVYVTGGHNRFPLQHLIASVSLFPAATTKCQLLPAPGYFIGGDTASTRYVSSHTCRSNS